MFVATRGIDTSAKFSEARLRLLKGLARLRHADHGEMAGYLLVNLDFLGVGSFP